MINEADETSDLHEGWVKACLGEIAIINPRHPNGIDASKLVTFVPMAALSESKPQFQYSEKRPLEKVRKGFTHFAEGDVLFAKITPCMENGKSAIARDLVNGLGCGTTELHVIRPLDGICPDYIYHFLHQEGVRSDAAAHFSGTAGQLRVPASFVANLRIPLPPSAEQKRIVAKVDALLSPLQAVRERPARVREILRRFRQAVLAAASDGRLTVDWRETHELADASLAIDAIVSLREPKLLKDFPPLPRNVEDLPPIPETWSWTTFGFVMSELQNGISTRPNIDPPGMPMLRINAVRPGCVLFDDVRFMPNGETLYPKYGIRDGDLLFTRYNGSIELLGICGLVRGIRDRKILHPDKLMRVRFDHDNVVPAYVELFFQSPGARHRITAKAKSSAGQQGVSGRDVKEQPLAVPPISEQREIVRRIEALFGLAEAIETRITGATLRIDKLTQSILTKAFRGDLVSSEAELARLEARDYEPAAILLDRIRETRVEPSRRQRKMAAVLDPLFPSTMRDKALCSAILDFVVAESGLTEVAYVEAIELLRNPTLVSKLLHDDDLRYWEARSKRAKRVFGDANETFNWFTFRDYLANSGALVLDAQNKNVWTGPQVAAVRRGLPVEDSTVIALVSKAAKIVRERQSLVGAARRKVEAIQKELHTDAAMQK